MNNNTARQLDTFCRHQQLNIWLKRIRARLTPLIWWCAIVFLLAGVIHQLIIPFNLLAATGIAMLPPLLILIRISLSQKPTMAEATIATDRALKANSLLVSSWELIHSPMAMQGISSLLLTRAEQALPFWRQRINSQSLRFVQTSTLAAFTLAVVGLFLLLLPPHAQNISALEKAAFLQKESVISENDAEATLKQLFLGTPKTTAEIQLLQTEQQAGIDAPHLVEELVQQKNDRTGGITRRVDTTQFDVQRFPSGATQLATEVALAKGSTAIEAENIFNQSAGSNKARHSDKVIPEAVEFDRISLIDITIEKNNGSVAFNRDLQGAELEAIQPDQSFLQSLSGPELQNKAYAGFATRLSAEQRYLVSRYFKQMEKIDESHE